MHRQDSIDPVYSNDWLEHEMASVNIRRLWCQSEPSDDATLLSACPTDCRPFSSIAYITNTNASEYTRLPCSLHLIYRTTRKTMFYDCSQNSQLNEKSDVGMITSNVLSCYYFYSGRPYVGITVRLGLFRGTCRHIVNGRFMPIMCHLLRRWLITLPTNNNYDYLALQASIKYIMSKKLNKQPS